MAFRDRISEMGQRFSDSLESQVWYQQAKQKWEELNPSTRKQVTLVSLFSAFAIGTSLSIWYYFHVRAIERDLYQKLAIIELINSSAEELRTLRNSRPATTASSQSWTEYFRDRAQSSNIDPAILQVSDEKQAPSNPKNLAKESYFTISLSKSNIIQITQFAFELENGTRPVKLKHLDIDTHADPEGYMDAQFAVSAFSLGDE